MSLLEDRCKRRSHNRRHLPLPQCYEGTLWTEGQYLTGQLRGFVEMDGVLLAVGPYQCFKKVIDKQWVPWIALRAHCKGLAEERSDRVNILKCSLEGGPTRSW